MSTHQAPVVSATGSPVQPGQPRIATDERTGTAAAAAGSDDPTAITRQGETPATPRPAVVDTSNPEAVRRHQCPPLTGDRMRTASGSTTESRMDELVRRLADADAISASRVRAWDRLQQRRSA